MDLHGRAAYSSAAQANELEEMDFRRGPWTVEEDLILMTYIGNHGEGRWNSLARCAGLKRTGKSCRLRWLNYLRPDVRRGNITPEEQLLILELHARWGNRWSKIAQHLPGRTDNEIKNYWRTRVQKHAKQLQCDVNSKQFKDVMRYLWMPRLLERIKAASGSDSATPATYQYEGLPIMVTGGQIPDPCGNLGQAVPSPESCSMAGSSSDLSPPLPVSDCLADCYGMQGDGVVLADQFSGWCPELLHSPCGYGNLGLLDQFEQNVWGEGMFENLWSGDDIWSVQEQQL